MDELPEFAHVIENLNKEYSILEEQTNKLKKELSKWEKFKMPRIKVNTIDEYFAYEVKIQDFMKYSRETLLNSHNFMELIDISDYSNHNYEEEWTKITDKLKTLTNNLNDKWCEHRIFSVLDKIQPLHDFIRYFIIDELSEGKIPHIIDYLLSQIMNGVTYDSYQLDENLSLYNLCIFDCERCGDTSDHLNVCLKNDENYIINVGLFCRKCEKEVKF